MAEDEEVVVAPQNNLGDVPGDVLIEIFEYCLLGDLTALAATCSYFRYQSLQHGDRLHLVQCMLRGRVQQRQFQQNPLTRVYGRGIVGSGVVGSYVSWVDLTNDSSEVEQLAIKNAFPELRGTPVHLKNTHYAKGARRLIVNDSDTRKAFMLLPGPEPECEVVQLPGLEDDTMMGYTDISLVDQGQRFQLFRAIDEKSSTPTFGPRNLVHWIQAKPLKVGDGKAPPKSAAFQGRFIHATLGVNMVCLALAEGSDTTPWGSTRLGSTMEEGEFSRNTSSQYNLAVHLIKKDLKKSVTYRVLVASNAYIAACNVSPNGASFVVYDPTSQTAVFYKAPMIEEGEGRDVTARAPQVIRKLQMAVVCLDIGNGDVLIFDSDGYMLFDLFSGRLLNRRQTEGTADNVFVLGEWRSNTKNTPLLLEPKTASIVIKDFNTYRALRLDVERPDDLE